MTDNGISGGRTCVCRGGRKCMSVINDGCTCMLGVNGYRTCLESTLASHVNDGCSSTGDQLSVHVCWGSTLAAHVCQGSTMAENVFLGSEVATHLF